MRTVFYALLTAFIFTTSVSCNNQKETRKEENKVLADSVQPKKDSITPPITGNDKDEHGCIGSAGYTWSVIKNDCIRLFESGIRLKQNGDDDSTGMSAFIILSKDEKQVELFLPDRKTSLMMPRSGVEGNEQWVADDFKLFPWKGGYVLNKGKKMIFAGHSNDL